MGRTTARRHLPHQLGPRLEQRGRYWSADCRPWLGARYTTLRDPKHPGWPDDGERTEDRDTAERWKWAYVDLLRGETRDRQQGRRTGRLLGPALEEYERHRSRTVSEATWKHDRPALDQLRECFTARTPVHRITTERLQRLFNEMADAGYAPGTLRNRRHDLSAFFRWLGGPNPCKGLELPDVTRSDDPFAWSDADVLRLRQSAGPLRTMLEVGLGTGARLGELLALRWSDFDERSKTVRIVRQFHEGTTRIVALKSKRARTALVLPAFWEHYRDEPGYCLGRALTSNMVYMPFQRLLTSAGVEAGPGHGAHDMRRTYGRLFLEAGGWMDELQRSLGHASIRTTEQQYGRFQAARAAEFARARIYGEGRLRLLG